MDRDFQLNLDMKEETMAMMTTPMNCANIFLGGVTAAFLWLLSDFLSRRQS